MSNTVISRLSGAGQALVAGAGAMLCISVLAGLEQFNDGALWLMAPFGATMVILFGLPDSPLAQPRNILFGHLLTTLVGLVVMSLCGVHPWSLGLAVGLAVSLMLLTGTTHPSAGRGQSPYRDAQRSGLGFPVVAGGAGGDADRADGPAVSPRHGAAELSGTVAVAGRAGGARLFKPLIAPVRVG